MVHFSCYRIRTREVRKTAAEELRSRLPPSLLTFRTPVASPSAPPTHTASALGKSPPVDAKREGGAMKNTAHLPVRSRLLPGAPPSAFTPFFHTMNGHRADSNRRRNRRPRRQCVELQCSTDPVSSNRDSSARRRPYAHQARRPSPASFGSFFPALGFFSAGDFSAAGFFSASFFSHLAAAIVVLLACVERV